MDDDFEILEPFEVRNESIFTLEVLVANIEKTRTLLRVNAEEEITSVY